MSEQLDALSQLTKLDHISLRVLPLDAGVHPAMVSPFILLHFDTEHDTGALYLERPADIERYTWIFTELGSLALDREASSA